MHWVAYICKKEYRVENKPLLSSSIYISYIGSGAPPSLMLDLGFLKIISGGVFSYF